MTLTVLSAVSTGLSALSSLSGGNARGDAADYSARVAENDAAARADAGRAQAEKVRLAYREQRGRARAALAGSGAAVDEGSAVLIDQDITRRGEQDALTAILSGDREAESSRYLAEQHRAASKNARSAGQLGALTSVLGGAAKIGAGWKGVPASGGSSGSGPGTL